MATLMLRLAKPMTANQVEKLYSMCMHRVDPLVATSCGICYLILDGKLDKPKKRLPSKTRIIRKNFKGFLRNAPVVKADPADYMGLPFKSHHPLHPYFAS